MGVHRPQTGKSAQGLPDDVIQHGLHGVDVVRLALQDGRVAHRHAHAAQCGDALIDLPFGAAGHFGAAHNGLQQGAHQRLSLTGSFDLVQAGPDETAFQKAEHEGVPAQRFNDVVDDEDHLVRKGGEALGLFTGGAGVVQQLVAHAGQQSLRHGTFVGKVEIKGALAHLGAGGDILYAGLGGPPLQKQFICRIQKRPALLLLFAFHGAHALSRFLFSAMFGDVIIISYFCIII